MLTYRKWAVMVLMLLAFTMPFVVLAQEPLAETYTTRDGSLSFNYPAGWIVEESTQEITIRNLPEIMPFDQLSPGDIQVALNKPMTAPEITSAMGIDVGTSATSIANMFLMGISEQFGGQATYSEVGPLAGREVSRVAWSNGQSDAIVIVTDLGDGTFVILLAQTSGGNLATVEPTLLDIATSINNTQGQPVGSLLFNTVPTVSGGPTSVVGVDALGVWKAASGLEGVAFSPDGAKIAATTIMAELAMWDTSGTPLWMADSDGNHYSIAYDLTGYTIATGGNERIQLWDANTGAEMLVIDKELEDMADPIVLGMCFNPDGTMLAAGAGNNVVLIELGWGTVISVMEGHTNRVTEVAFSPDGKLIASSSNDGTVRVWNADSGALLQTFTGQSEEWRSVAFSPEGTKVAAGGQSTDGAVQVWDVTTGATTVFSGSSEAVYFMEATAYSPNGALIASGDLNGRLWIWDAETGQELVTWRAHIDEDGHYGGVTGIDFSPDGTQLVSASDDFHDGVEHTVRVWGLR